MRYTISQLPCAFFVSELRRNPFHHRSEALNLKSLSSINNNSDSLRARSRSSGKRQWVGNHRDCQKSAVSSLARREDRRPQWRVWLSFHSNALTCGERGRFERKDLALVSASSLFHIVRTCYPALSATLMTMLLIAKSLSPQRGVLYALAAPSIGPC